MNCIHLFLVYPQIFLFSLMTKPLNTQNEWVILMLIRASSGWILCCVFGCKSKIHIRSTGINQVCKEIHTATLCMKLTSVVCKLEIKINLSNSKVKFHSFSQSIGIVPSTPNPYAPPTGT